MSGYDYNRLADAMTDAFLKSADKKGGYYKRCGICGNVDHITADHHNPAQLCSPCWRRECQEELACDDVINCPCECTIGGR